MPAYGQQQPPPQAQNPPVPAPLTVSTAPVLGEGFVLGGQWLAAGVVSLDWGDVESASGYELMLRRADGWVLLSEDGPSGGVFAALEGSSARVAGLPADGVEWWFAVRARNAFGVSEWSPAAAVRAPQRFDVEPLFDPFTAPTRSGIDLERLREAVATVTPGEADCAAAPTLDVEGVMVVDPPAGLDDPDAVLTVAEVVRVAGGCLIVEHVALAGRTVAQVRELLAADASVHAVGEPVRGVRLDHDPPATQAHASHTGGHHNDGAIEQWHLPQPTMTALWSGWNDDTDHQVVVAVLDSGVDTTHPDLENNIAPDNPEGCHISDDKGHGTRMAGIIAAELGDGHVAGVAPKAKILPLRVTQRKSCTATPAPVTPPEGIAEAVNRGARVINMSFAGPDRHDDTDVVVGGIGIPSYDTYGLALRAAAMLGVVALTSAGNCGDDSDEIKKEVTMKDWEWKGCPEHNARERPAVYDDVISVASIGISGSSVASSSVHEHVDVAAPGVAIHTSTPCSIKPSCVDDSGGTSAAAAFVSGVVAHMLNRHPEATVGQVRRALEVSARDRGAVGRDDEYGHGIVYPAGAVEELGSIIARELEPVVPSGGFESLSAGGSHTCGLYSSGAVRCWGAAEVVAETPRFAFKSLSSAPTADFVCGVRGGDGAVMCWGDVAAEVTTDVAGSGLDIDGDGEVEGVFSEVTVGDAHVCGVRPNGRAVCWGDNSSGQTDTPFGRFGQSTSPYVTRIMAGSRHTCAISRYTGLVCWGERAGGRLLPSFLPFTTQDISLGEAHTCLIDSDHLLHCYGNNSHGVLNVPDGQFKGFSAGANHTCALAEPSGALSCWGDSAHMLLDAPDGSFEQVAAGGSHNCGRGFGRVICWGDDTSGQAPAGGSLAGLSLTVGGVDLLAGMFMPDVFDYTVTPQESSARLHAEVGGIDVAHSRIVFGSGVGGALSSTGSVDLSDGDTIEVRVRALWGEGALRTYRIRVVEPPRLTALSVSVSGGGCAPVCPPLALSPAFDPGVFDYSVVAPADVSEVTVSYAAAGGAAVVSPVDVDSVVAGYQVGVGDAGSFVSVDAGWSHSCGVMADLTLRCWGGNDDGELDAPSGAFSAVSSGAYHSCGLRIDESVVCWGGNIEGEADAPSGSFSWVSAGGLHSCGVVSRVVRCWGWNLFGQTQMPLNLFRTVSAGGVHSCTQRLAGDHRRLEGLVLGRQLLRADQ